MARNMKKYTFFRCGILWLSMLISNLKSQSFLDMEEISRMKYGVIISNNPVLFNEKIGENELIISSKHGQQYVCTLPEIQVDLNVEQKNSNFHYSLVTKILDEAFNRSCLTYHKGWWSYNVCHKDKIEQFHVENDAKISSVTLLGFYESEDYSNVSVSESEMLNGPVHNQKYTNGAICDLTSKPRSSVVKYICGENNAVLQVDEPESCQYVVTISSIKLCSHPLFKKQEENEHFNMVCSPSLSQDAYSKYLKLKKNKQANSKELKGKNKEKEAAANKKPDIKNIFQDLKDTATGLGMLFGSFFGELGMQKIAAPIKSEAEEKQIISSKNVSPIVTEDIPPSEGKQDHSKREKISAEIFEDNQKTELNKLPLEGNTKSSKISPLETDVADKFYSQKGQLSIEYSQLKESAKDEIQMSKKMLEKMQKKVDESETPAEKIEWEKLVKLLKEDIKKFEDQMSVLDQQMTEIEKVENEAERNLHIVNDEITSERKLKKIASALKSTNKFEKSLIDHTTEKLSNSKLKNAEASESSLSASLKQLDKIYKIFQKGIRDIQMKDNDAKPKDSQDEIIKKNSVNQNSKSSKLSKHVSSINDKDQNGMSIPNEEINDKKNTDDKMTKHSKTLENDKESNENDENMLEVKFGVQSFDDLANEIDMDDGDENLVDKNAKDIEVAVKKQLQEAGFKMNDNIKIKIITSKEKFDKYNANSKLLSTSGSFDFKDLLMGLLGNSKEKETEENRYNALQSNYDTVYDENEAEEENKLEEGDWNDEVV
ncbi:protein OS-9 isoform X4 [Hydra vulgaris]|uniref:Protein OS-9 isoform X4 n=1 Tax=Hydra vulgaris TaxID=6087 RepID=A0ABM4CYA3_HYDVU